NQSMLAVHVRANLEHSRPDRRHRLEIRRLSSALHEIQLISQLMLSASGKRFEIAIRRAHPVHWLEVAPHHISSCIKSNPLLSPLLFPLPQKIKRLDRCERIETCPRQCLAEFLGGVQEQGELICVDFAVALAVAA